MGAVSPPVSGAGADTIDAEYQVIYDAAAPAFKLVPALLVLNNPIALAGCFYAVEAAAGRCSRSLKWAVWSGFVVYALLVAAGYWETWQSARDARAGTGARVVEGALTDGQTVYRQTSRRTWGAFQRFTVNGVAFEERDWSRELIDALLPHVGAPTLPLIEGAHLRVTYRDGRHHRTILKFEIAAADLERHD